MTVERDAAVALKWNSVAKLTSQLFSWLVTWLLLRILTPEDYGLMAVCAVFVSLLAGLAEFGLGSSIIQSQQLQREDLAKISGALGLLNLACAVLLFLAAPLLAESLGDQRLADVIRVFSVQFVFFAIEAVPQALLQRNMQFKTIAGIELGATLATSSCSLALALLNFGVWALVIGTLFGSATRTILSVIFGTYVAPSWRLSGIARHIQFGGVITATRFLWQITYQLDTLIAARFLGREAVGLYSVSTHLANLPMTKTMGIVNQVAFPAVARLQDDLTRMRGALLDGVRMLALVAIPTLWGLSAVAPDLIDAVLGEKWHDAVFALQLISLVAPLRMLMAVLATATAAIGRAEVELRNTIVGVIVLPLAYLIGVQWGLNGLAAAWLVAVPLLLLLNFPRTSRALKVPFRDLFGALRGPLLAGALLYACVLGARTLLGDVSALVRLPALIVVGALVYALSLRLFDQRIWVDARRLLVAVRG